MADLLVAKAHLACRTGDFPAAVTAYDAVFNREKVGTNKKIDATMSKCRVALFLMDLPECKRLLAEAQKLNDVGGDWDRRNRLKVYEAMYLLAVRDIKKATELLASCIATFTCVEICEYNDFMFYALLTAVLHIPRVELKKKIITNPQVITVIKEVKHMAAFVSSFYECEYAKFFQTLLDVGDTMASDRYIGPHATYLLREFRVLAYSQFLEAYRSVTVATMAGTFGMPLDLLDAEVRVSSCSVPCPAHAFAVSLS